MKHPLSCRSFSVDAHRRWRRVCLSLFGLLFAGVCTAHAQPAPPYSARTYDLRVTLICENAHCGTPNANFADMDDVRKALRQMVALVNFTWSESNISFRLRDDMIRVMDGPDDLPFADSTSKDMTDCAGQRYCDKDIDCYLGANDPSACVDNACTALCDANGGCKGGPSVACVTGKRTEDPNGPDVDYCTCDMAEYERRYASDDPTVVNVIMPVDHRGRGASWWTKDMAFLPFPRAFACSTPVDLNQDERPGGCLYDGTLLAHELGHYFGQSHTHSTGTDAAKNAWSDFDIDGLADTAPDPAEPNTAANFGLCQAPAGNFPSCPADGCGDGQICQNDVCIFGVAVNQVCNRGLYVANACSGGGCVADACVDVCSRGVCAPEGGVNQCANHDIHAGPGANGSCANDADCAFEYDCIANRCTFGALADWTFASQNFDPANIRAGQAFCVGGGLVFLNNRWIRDDELQLAQNQHEAYTPLRYGSPICYWRRPDPNNPNAFVTQEIVWQHWAPPGGWQAQPNRIICDDGACLNPTCNGNPCPAGSEREIPGFTNLMGYHLEAPAVIDGVRYSALTAEQLARIDETFLGASDCDTQQEYAATGGRCGARRRLVDVCATRGGDTDRDGICDQDDLCPGSGPLGQSPHYLSGMSNLGVPTVVDDDNDGVPNECDLCLNTADPSNGDLDGDGLGDACDPDRDNDGCPNALDKDPDDPMMVSHQQMTFNYLNCASVVDEAMQFAGEDHDQDGTLSCHIFELDSDGDGKVDAKDPSPLVPGLDVPRPANGDCVATLVNGCFGPDCYLDFTVRIESFINPVWFIELPPVFALAEDGVFFRPTDQAAVALRDVMVQLENSSYGSFRLSVRKSSQVLGQWKLAKEHFNFALQGHGGFIKANLPGNNEDPVYFELVQGSTIAPDTDGDGVIDPIDNCTAVPNPSQHDRDLNRVGDQCDGDVDGDGTTDSTDLAFVQSCLNTRVAVTANQFGAEVDIALACGPADLNHDGVVDQADIDDVIKPQWKQPIGPSAWVP